MVVFSRTMRACIGNPTAGDKTNIGLVVMLEALRPTPACSFTPPEVETLVGLASFNDPALSEVARFLLEGWSAQLNPLSSLRARLLDAPEESTEVVEAALRSAQDLLRTQVATLWSAAGGKIQHTHCRAAWTKFIQSEVVPLRDALAPTKPSASSKDKWTPNRIRQHVIALGRSFKRIMDTEQVKHQDRSAAEGAAQQIVEAIEVVSDALQRLEAQRIPCLKCTGGPFGSGMRSHTVTMSAGPMCARCVGCYGTSIPRLDARLPTAGLLSVSWTPAYAFSACSN
jgi:hypothetical protein